MMKEEMELRGLADQAVAKEEALLSAAAPKGKFTEKNVNALINVVNKVMSLFGNVPSLPRIKGDVTSFDADTMARLMALHKALKQYDDVGEYEMPDPTAIKDDNGVIQIIVVLDKLGKDKGFKKFLKSPPPEMESEEVEMEEPTSEGKSPMLSEDQMSEVSMAFGK